MLSLIAKLRHFDAYPKPLEDFRIKTVSGALISTFTAIIAITLFISEWRAFNTIEVDQELFVDLTRNQKLTINLNMTFTHLPCSLLSLDAMDISGEHVNDVVKGLKKVSLSSTGDVITSTTSSVHKSEPTTKTSSITTEHIPDVNANNSALDTPKCMSCYGAEAANFPCCNTCDDVRQAYRQKNWHFSPYGVEQCKKDLEDAEGNVKASELSRDLDSVLKLLDSKEGCRIVGHLEVNKVAGNFHIAPGISYQQNHVHVHDIKNLPLEKFNTNHFFEQFTFGQEYPSQFNPLERKNFKPPPVPHPSETNQNNMRVVDFGVFQLFQENPNEDVKQDQGDSLYHSYFLKVVPTVYEYLDGRIVNNTYQYSVTKSTKIINSASAFTGQLPGVFVNYELSAIMVKYVERSKSLTHFLTSCCAIIGGLFTIAGMLDAFTFRYYNMYKKYQMNKLT